jgi:septum formation topological specificity factor MinE
MSSSKMKIKYMEVLCQYWKIKLVMLKAEGAEMEPEQYACTAQNMLPGHKTLSTLCACFMNFSKMQIEYIEVLCEYWEIESMMLEVEEVLL